MSWSLRNGSHLVFGGSGTMQNSPSVRHAPLISSSGPRADRFYDSRAFG